MKYFSLDSVIKGFKNNSSKTSDGFWGIMAILRSIDGKIIPGKAYLLNANKVADFLEEWFSVRDTYKDYNITASWYVVFSDDWMNQLKLFVKGNPNIFDVIVWMYQHDGFDIPSINAGQFDAQALLTRFCSDTSLELSVLKELFDIKWTNIESANTCFSQNEKNEVLEAIYGNKGKNSSIKCNGLYIVSEAGQFQRAPFIQTLYASTETFKCLMMNNSSPEKYYPSLFLPSKKDSAIDHEALYSSQSIDNLYLCAMRTKPFLLLAGISGTGKSRIVKQMAFDSCPDNNMLRSDLTSPGNYCLIEVKPNWHDSTELLGYESKIGGAHYQLSPFVKFLAKAMLHPTVPFFVCLDEMNLAPVEQYFAEFLSVLESRTKIDGHIVSEPLVKSEIFANKDYELKLQDELFGLELKEEVTADGRQRLISGKLPDKAQLVYDTLKEQGLRIPENVIVIGTVNMDETTHQFSRKVIDRAMTIEMNLPEGEPFMDFFNNASELGYRSTPISSSLYLATETKASDVVKALSENNSEKTDWLKGEVASFLTNLNEKLDGTPFKVAYRVQNELMLYFYQLWLEDKTARWRDVLNTACDQILMMKVLPRIEGDEELLGSPLEELANFCKNFTNAERKIAEMRNRLEKSQFTSFWP